MATEIVRDRYYQYEKYRVGIKTNVKTVKFAIPL